MKKILVAFDNRHLSTGAIKQFSSALSRLFRQSMVNDAITEHRLPVFIAHR